MFSLIITIVSIALVVALVAATMYSGGDTLTQGRARADASAYISGAQQISAAAIVYSSNEGATPTSLADLKAKNYMTATPTLPGGSAYTIAFGTRTIDATVTSRETCTQINKAARITDDGVTTSVTIPATSAYGCSVAGTTYAFSYKY